MQTLGIDLSTDPKKVWTCEIDWSQSPPRVLSLVQLSTVADPLVSPNPPPATPRDDSADAQAAAALYTARSKPLPVRTEPSLIAELVERIVAFGPDAQRLIGIDAPLGWPAAFVEAVADWDDGDLHGFRKRPDLRLRATDRFLQAVARVTPMSVSTDRMGSTSMLLAEVLSRAARRLDRPTFERASGGDGIVEVHPAAALRSWTHGGTESISTSAYKGWHVPRETIVIKIARAGFELSPAQASAMIRSDDALDAFVCALVAWATARGECHAIAEPIDVQQLLPRPSTTGRGDSVEQLTERLDLARSLQAEASRTGSSEGWIQLPKRGDLASALGTTPGTASWSPEPTRPPEPFRSEWLDEEMWLDEAEARAAELGYSALGRADWEAVADLHARSFGDRPDDDRGTDDDEAAVPRAGERG